MEGGPKQGGKADLSEMRQAFREFLGVNTSVTITLWGDVQRAYTGFTDSLDESNPEHIHILLVDSEEAFKENQTLWLHVKNRKEHKLDKPPGATEDQLYFMAQCMEAWFVADSEKFKEFYGPKLGKLPPTQDVEEISKEKLLKDINTATKKTQKGEYHKINHVSTLFKLIRRQKVSERAPNCKRLLEFLQNNNFSKN
jgi:hypothetical protein